MPEPDLFGEGLLCFVTMGGLSCGCGLLLVMVLSVGGVGVAKDRAGPGGGRWLSISSSSLELSSNMDLRNVTDGFSTSCSSSI